MILVELAGFPEPAFFVGGGSVAQDRGAAGAAEGAAAVAEGAAAAPPAAAARQVERHPLRGLTVPLA